MGDLSVEVNYLETLPVKTVLRLVDMQNSCKKNAEAFGKLIADHKPLFLWLEQHDLDVGFDIRYGSMDLYFSGDGRRLGSVWGELRRSGFECGSRPKKGDTSFTGFFRKEGFPHIYLSFSSTLCKRVQVGTQLVEQPIYETQCAGDDLGELPNLAQTAISAL